jgi:hypothetical protein
MNLLRDWPRTSRQSGAFLVAVGVIVMSIGPLQSLLSRRSPSLVVGLLACVIACVFLGAGIPFVLRGDAATKVFGQPRQFGTWPTWWWSVLATVGVSIFFWLRWRAAA